MAERAVPQGLFVDGLSILGCRPLTFHIAAGECVSLSGPSGSGKTMLLRALADLDEHAGQVFFDGVESEKVKPALWRRQLGLLLAESQWWSEHVADHFPPPDAGHPAAFGLQVLGFSAEALQWNVARLSSGERQRLALLRLLALRPRVLLLDEPTANLDPTSTRLVEQVIGDFRRQNACPVLWVSHDAEQRQRIAQRHLEFATDGLRELS